MPEEKKPKFKQKDVVTMIGITGPTMLISSPSSEDDELGFLVICSWFDKNNELQRTGFPEELLQLVMPAAVVQRVADQLTAKARLLEPNTEFAVAT